MVGIQSLRGNGWDPINRINHSHDPDFQHQRHCGRWCKIQREDIVCACYQIHEFGDDYHHGVSYDPFNN